MRLFRNEQTELFIYLIAKLHRRLSDFQRLQHGGGRFPIFTAALEASTVPFQLEIQLLSRPAAGAGVVGAHGGECRAGCWDESVKGFQLVLSPPSKQRSCSWDRVRFQPDLAEIQATDTAFIRHHDNAGQAFQEKVFIFLFIYIFMDVRHTQYVTELFGIMVLGNV